MPKGNLHRFSRRLNVLTHSPPTAVDAHTLQQIYAFLLLKRAERLAEIETADPEFLDSGPETAESDEPIDEQVHYVYCSPNANPAV